MNKFVVWRVPHDRRYQWRMSAPWERVSEHATRWEAVAACNPPDGEGFTYAVRHRNDPPPLPRPMLSIEELQVVAWDIEPEEEASASCTSAH